MDEKEILFKLAKSHSKLASAEYDKNPGYNDEHFSHKAEMAVIKYFAEKGWLQDFFEYLKNEDGAIV